MEMDQAERRITFLERQNKALLDALMRKTGKGENDLIRIIIEQQKLILNTAEQLGELKAIVGKQHKQLLALYQTVNKKN